MGSLWKREHELLPAMFLTKIWIVSSAVADEDDDVDESDEMLLERLGRMVSSVFV